MTTNAPTSAPIDSSATRSSKDTQPVAVLKHRRASRWMHWINFPLITIMIWSGLRIYWAEDVYAFGLGSWEWFHWFPDWFYELLDLDRHLARGLAFHLNFAWLFALNGVIFGIYSWRSGEWRELVPSKRALRNAWAVLLHDLHIRKEAPPKVGRYNEAQRITYSLVIGLGALALVSGFAIYKPTQLSFLTWALGGYGSARLIHFCVTIAFMVFFAIHILQVARAGWRNFASMVTGYELQPEIKDPDPTTTLTAADGQTTSEVGAEAPNG